MGGENIESTSFLFLPDDVVILLFSYCDLQTLGRLACSCKRFAKIIKGDCIWRRRLRQLTRVKCYMLNAFAQLVCILRFISIVSLSSLFNSLLKYA